MTQNPDQIRNRIIDIVLASAEGQLTRADLAGVGGSLASAGYSSLAYIRMLDAVENELGVYLDPEVDSERLATLDGIVALVVEALVPVDA